MCTNCPSKMRGPSIPSVTLTNGQPMPLFGLGTWNAKNEEEVRAALRSALDNGYRLIDTAMWYMNERIIGTVLKEYFKEGKLRREDVFITTKLPPTDMYAQETEKAILSQLEALQLDYIDLYLIHCPVPFKFKDPNNRNLFAVDFIEDLEHIDTWRIMEKYCKLGKLKALGLSNFSARQITDLYAKAEIKPANLQVELHIYCPQHELQALCKKLNISVTGYAPIGSPGRKMAAPDRDWPEGDTMSDGVVVELAKKYKKTPAQIQLRHLIQRGICVIPKSTNPARIMENVRIFDFELSQSDQQKLLDITKRVRLFLLQNAIGHKHYPYDDVDTAHANSSEAGL